MPFALPEYDTAFSSFMASLVSNLARARDPLLAKISFGPKIGPAGSLVQERGSAPLVLPGQSTGFGLTMDVEAVRNGDLDQLVVELDKASDEYARQLVGLLFSNLEKVTNSTGNVLDAKGRLTFEHIYEMLDQIEWSLNDDDELSLPDLVMHPDTVKNLPQLTEEQEAQLEVLKTRKHEELLARRRRRRLS
jgi:hypothetical protein